MFNFFSLKSTIFWNFFTKLLEHSFKFYFKVKPDIVYLNYSNVKDIALDIKQYNFIMLLSFQVLCFSLTEIWANVNMEHFTR